MRVATLFTGVAAMTVGIAQAADAQEAGQPAPKHVGAIRPAVKRIDGSIQYDDSCWEFSQHPNWQHVATNFPFESGHYGQVRSVCFGFKGILVSPPGVGVYSECGGNNHGWLDGDNNGTFRSFGFGPGTTYAKLNWSHLSEVMITSWTGADKCGMIPGFGSAPVPGT
jgi:hypothetical protein